MDRCRAPELMELAHSGPRYADDNRFQVLENEDHNECNPIIIDMYPYDEEISINTCEPITDILETLKSSVQGLAVLNYYKNHRTLNVNTSITPERLHELALLIPGVFVLELCDTYYVPYSREKSKKTSARGKFHTRYNHWRDILIKSGSTPNCRALKRKIIDESAPRILIKEKISGGE
ncbi:hypothetical protein KQX54_011962 [Cotesia glomerata]|uniref:Uncharacterized protein n=1 Tax=Cotesia glomerata TaxID=32391 RepID=A0AAV7HWS2_COTGL|nr:hypothetical protein KQX54_011962 [Cotesia glomerata]